jgi:hypothetical protein
MEIEINLEELHDYLWGKTCLHTFKHSFEWAAKNSLPKEAIEELANELDVPCDCELGKILLDLGETFEVELGEKSTPNSNRWMIPPDFALPPLNKIYHQWIVSPSSSETTERCYTNPDEILIPAPMGYKPSKKMRKVRHFFVGLDSSLPSEVGVVKSCAPITAPEFLEMIKGSQLPDFEGFDLPIAFVYLEAVAKMKIGHGVGVSFLEECSDFGKFKRIFISRKLL